MSESIKMLNSSNFDSEVLQANGLVIVDFWAEWCGPCRMLAPVLEELAKDYAGKVTICKLNVDESGDIAERYSIMSIPTLFVFKNGEIVDKSIGLVAKSSLAKMIDAHLSAL